MPRIIKDGRVVEDDWHGQLLALDEFNALGATTEGPVGVILETDQPPSAIEGVFTRLELIAVNFPAFTDGRGFSCARELRERGYTGELRATGHFIRDQLYYLARCGFNAFQFQDDANIEACLDSLHDFSEAYQASIDKKDPLFRRR